MLGDANIESIVLPQEGIEALEHYFLVVGRGVEVVGKTRPKNQTRVLHLISILKEILLALPLLSPHSHPDLPS